MDSDLLESVFDAARSIPAPERREYLTARLAGSPELIEEATRLLEAHDRNIRGFLDTPALGEGFNVLDLPASESHPTHIGPYKVVSLLSGGDSALVYLAEVQEPRPRPCAIKVLRSASQRREILKRFEMERGALAEMDHPNIARFFESGSTGDGRAYFVMEYVPGRPITAHAAAQELNRRQRLRLFIDVCHAVEHAHQRGVIHRDLKPSNILVTEDGLAKVIDFGIARAVSGADAVTLTGQLIGTPAYISPELLRGLRTPDTRADVYSLGVVLYELLSGSLPHDFGDAGPAGSAALVLSEEPRPLRGYGDIAFVVSKALERDPDRRYNSVSDFRADVERVLAGRPVSARRARLWYIASRFVIRNKVAVAAVSCAIGVAGVAVWHARRSDRERIELAMNAASSLVEATVEFSKRVGNREQRRPLLRTLEEISANLEREAPSDLRVIQLRADVLAALADLEQERGRLDQASAAAAACHELRVRLAAAYPDSPEAAMDLSIALVRRGDVAGAIGDHEATRTAYEAALQIDEGVVKRHPRNRRAVSNLGWSLDRVGKWLEKYGRESEAVMYRQRQVAVFEQLATLDDGVDVLRALSQSYSLLSLIAAEQGDAELALDLTNRARDHARRAHDKDPDDRLALTRLLMSTLGVWSNTREMGGPAPPPREVHDLVGEAERYAAQDPGDQNACWTLASVLSSAATQLRDVEPGAARDYARRAIAQWKQAMQLRPGDTTATEVMEGVERLLRSMEE